MNRKNVILWTLYDFANSISTIVFFLYFSQWLVIDHGVSDFAYNMLFTIGSILLLMTAPVLGSIADKTYREQKYLNRITVFTFIFFVLTALTTLFFTGSVLLAAFFFLISNYLYQFSFVFYNALLEKIAPPEKCGTISGIGQAANWIGQIVGLVVTIPLASGAIYLFGAPGRAQTFLPASIIFFFLSLPMLLWFKLPKRETPITDITTISYAQEYKSQWRQFKDLIKEPNMRYFLLSYFFFNDAILTASNNFPIYLEKVFAVTDSTKSLLLIGILVTSAVGALVSGWASDRIGTKTSLMIILGSWAIIFPLMGLTNSFAFFVVLAILMGFFFGATWTVTRTAMVALCPKDKLNFGFSFYTIAERISTLIGPLTWGLITMLLANTGSMRYRVAIIAMGGFAAIGSVILSKAKIRETTK
ncbi:MAG: MFS transporter [Candidatus Gracilibacteria bacterium]